MANEVTVDSRLQNALSAETCKARTGLLASSLIGIAIEKVGLIPTKISALGIEFDKPSREHFAVLVSVFVAYYLISFSIYAWADFLLWYSKKKQVGMGFRVANALPSFLGAAGAYKLSIQSGLLSWLRVFLDFIAPTMASLYAIYNLVELAKRI